MEHKAEHDLSHRQEREQEKVGHKHTEPKVTLSAVHPAWYIVVAVITCGIAVLIWTVIS
jgi:hypothetical protein